MADSAERILLLGASGQLGWELRKCLFAATLVAPERGEVDLASRQSIVQAIRHIRPALVVNAAAYTKVDRAESERDLARATNAIAPALIAGESRKIGAAVIHYSTDYVFNGRKIGPYVEDDPPNPSNVYGLTKLEGERALAESGVPHIIIRTSWLYGARRRNFVLTILNLARKSTGALRVVDDQIGAPTWTRSIAQATAAIIARAGSLSAISEMLTQRGGIYQLSAGGETTRYGWAKAILDEYVRRHPGAITMPRLIPAKSTEFATPAARPQNSLLSNRKIADAFGIRLDNWRLQLAQAMAEVE